MTTGKISRRDFIAAGTAFWVTRGESAENAARLGAIDVHHHILPPDYIEVARPQLARTIPNMAATLDTRWTPAQSIEQMDRHGIATSIASISAPGIWFGDARETKKLARLCNEYAARLRRDHVGRFGAFAVLPVPDVDASIAEIAHALDVLHLDGIGVLTSYGDMWLGDPSLGPVFDELNRRKATVYVHPTAANCCVNTLPEIHSGYLEFPFDTTRTIASLLYAGTLARCPDIRFIFSHGGGALASVNARLAAPSRQPRFSEMYPDGVLATLQKLFFDTASVTNKPSFDGLSALVPVTQIMFGTDYPFGPPLSGTMDELAALGVDESDLELIRRGNAARMFPQYSEIGI